MIAAVGLAPGLLRALTPAEQPDDLAELIDRHDRVIEVLREHAVVRVSSSEDLGELNRALEALASLSPDARKRWEALFTFLDKHRRLESLDPAGEPSLDFVESAADLAAGYASRIEVAALPPSQATKLGVAPGDVSTFDASSSVEITKGPLLRRSKRIGRFIGLAKSGVVAHDYKRDQWLDQVLRPIFEFASAVDIVDHYLYGELVRRRDKGLRRAEPEHVGWLLAALGAAGGPRKRVRLLGGIGEASLPGDTDEAATLVRGSCLTLGPSIAELKIIGGKWKSPQTDMPHDRHISTDLGVAIEIPAGLDRFRDDKVTDSSGVSWTFRAAPSSYRKCQAERERVLGAAGTCVVLY